MAQEEERERQEEKERQEKAASSQAGKSKRKRGKQVPDQEGEGSRGILLNMLKKKGKLNKLLGMPILNTRIILTYITSDLRSAGPIWRTAY
jgi:hypothetical protein